MVCHLIGLAVLGDGSFSHGVPSFRETGRRVENMARACAIDLSTKNHAGTFEAWSRHLAKRPVEIGGPYYLPSTEEHRHNRVNIRQWRHTILRNHPPHVLSSVTLLALTTTHTW